MTFLKKYRLGLIIGFLFGTVGMWLMAIFSLMSQYTEVLTRPFFAVSRGIASLLITGSSASTGMVIVLYVITGALYAIVGLLIQLLVQKTRSAA